MNQKLNKKFAAKKQLEASDINQQIRKLAEENGLNQKFSIFLENVPKSVNDSVELKKTTKGVAWNIKCYGESSEAMERANTLFNECEKMYGETDKDES